MRNAHCTYMPALLEVPDDRTHRKDGVRYRGVRAIRGGHNVRLRASLLRGKSAAALGSSSTVRLVRVILRLSSSRVAVPHRSGPRNARPDWPRYHRQVSPRRGGMLASSAAGDTPIRGTRRRPLVTFQSAWPSRSGGAGGLSQLRPVTERPWTSRRRPTGAASRAD